MAIGKPLGNMVIELGLDSSAFSKNLKGASQAVRSATSEMKANFNIIDAGGNKVQALGAKQKGLQKIIEAQKNEVKELTKAYKDSYTSTGEATSKTADLARKVNDAESRLAGYKSQLKQVSIEMKLMESKSIKVGDRLQSFGGGLQKVGDGISGFGKKMTLAFTAPVVAFGGMLVKNGIQVQKFREQAKVYYTNMFNDAEKATKHLDSLMTYAKTTPYAYETIVEMDKTLNTFGVHGDKAQKILSTIAETVAGVGGSQEDLKEVSVVFGQIASSGRLNTQDMNQLINRGIPAFQIVANTMNMTVEELRDGMKKGAISSEDAIEALTNGLMNGTEGINGATTGYKNSLEEVKKTLPGAIDSFKSAQKNLALKLIDSDVYSGMTDALRKMTDVLKSDAIIPVIEKISDVLGAVVSKVADFAVWLTKLSPAQQEFGIKMAGVLAVTGPLLIGLGGILSIVGKFSSTIGLVISTVSKWVIVNGGLLSVLTGPGGVVLAIGAVVAGLILFYKNSETFRDAVKTMWEQVKVIFNAGAEFIKQVFSTLWKILPEAFNAFKSLFKGDFNGFWNSITNIFNIFMADLPKLWSKGWELVKSVVSLGWTYITTFFSSAFKILSNVTSVGWEVLKKVFEFGIGLLKNLVKDLWTGLQILFTLGVGVLKTVASNMWNDFKTIFSLGVGVLKTVASNMWNDFKNIFNAGISIIKSVVSSFLNGLQIIFTTVFNTIKGIISTVWNSITLIFRTVTDIIKNIINSFMNTIRSIISTISESIRNIFNTVWNGIRSFLSGVIGAIITNTVDRFNGLKNSLSNIFTTIKTSISSIWDSIKNTLSDKVNSMVTKVREMPGLMGQAIRNGGSALSSAFVSIWENAVKGVAKPANLIIKGANWILEKFGSSTRVAQWTPYAKGTDGHKGGSALVNDQKGPVYREAIQFPNGETIIPRGRNLLIPDMPKGTKVLPAKETKGMYRYAKGVGVWEKPKQIVNKLKEKAINVLDYFTKPGELIKDVLAKFVSYNGLVEAPLAMAKGLVGKTTSSMSDWVKKLFTTEQSYGTDHTGPTMGGIGFRGLVRTSPFGWRTHPISGGKKFHAGVDMAGGQRTGHPIHAQMGGTVNFAGRMGGYGNVVKVAIGNLEHMYAHLSKILVGVGTLVTPGRLVGLMGSTGNSTGPHVHYEVRRNGRPIPPGFENGGLIKKHMIAQVGEGNKPEMIIPLTKRSRAYELILQAIEYLGISDKGKKIKDNTTSNGADTIVINIDEMVVRSDNDIELIAEKLLELKRRKERGR